jgi:hypothetical protein
MVVNSDPSRKRQLELERELNIPEDVRKDAMFAEMRKESLSLITLAYMYAKNFAETGLNITERWTVALEQNELIQRVYDKGYTEGYAEGVQKGRELERKKKGG